jgi:hypothetical protein
MKCLLINRYDGGVSIKIAETEERCLIDAEKDQLSGVYKEHEAFISHRFIDFAEYERAANETKEEFRNAWCDVTPEPSIDIDCARAKDIQLERLRRERDALLKSTDVELTRALESGNAATLELVKLKRQQLRDVTEPLKALIVANVINDEGVLQQIRELGRINE